MKKAGGKGGCNNPLPRPEREVVAAKIDKISSNFDFLIFSFCHNNDYVPEILET